MQSADFYLIPAGVNFFYFTKKNLDGAFLIGKPGSWKIYVNGMNYEYAKKLFGKVYLLKKNTLRNLLRGKRVGVPLGYVSAVFYKNLVEICEVVDITEDLLELRMSKSAEEIENLKKASEIAKKVLDDLELSSELTEKEVERMLRVKVAEAGYEVAFSPIVLGEKNAKYPHGKPESAKLGSYVLIDFGVNVNGYKSDITRVFFLKSTKAELIYESIVNAFWEIFDVLSECISGEDVHNLYLKIFKRLHLPRMPHLIGHGIGLEVHEKPHLKKGSKDPIDGTVIAIEPAVYKKYGLRYEEDVYIKNGKPKLL